jgi:flagellin
LKTLAVQGASSTFTGSLSTLANEMKNDIAEINRQAGNIGLTSSQVGTGSTTTPQTAAGQNVANLSVYIGGGLGNNNAQIGSATEGVNLAAGAVDAIALGINGLTTTYLSNATNFQAAIGSIASAVGSLGTVQGTVGAGINQLNFAIGLAQSQVTNYAADESGIRDADMATEASNLSKSQVLVQSSIAAMAQANQIPQAVLKLLQ